MSLSSSSFTDTYTPHVLDFCSDHFPIVMDFENISIASFNVLNHAYIKHL
ncbi:MAG: hypothetical protein Sylvanvirus9_3 [Sylvanvirus sp.]|uniref:Uncharacterized protein n=1 Tax=Sylvanvirus sp. TaxID=2487774 RepID=A0A3G5AKH6_9VIRU|nr:MAG: hypothetical protein Sylvanvirus9_3 [Sylvanvirus sp.]